MPSRIAPSRATAVLSVVFAALLLGSILAPAVGATAPDRTAKLVVEQPHYIEEGVTTERTNQTTVYVARGEQLTLYPQNFDVDNVVNYGVTTEGAEMSLDPKTDTFTLSPSQEGTYHLFFVVERTVVVDGENATANNSTASDEPKTLTRQIRYEASVRVAGGLDLVHKPAGSLEELRASADNWQEFNATMHQMDLVGAAGTEAAVQEMLRWYELRKHPQEALTGHIVAYLILGATSTAILVWIVFFGGHARIVRAIRRKLNIHEAIEAEEGQAKEALAELERQQNERNRQNMDWQDLNGFDDHIAAAFREVFGDTVGEGTVEYISTMRPRNVIRDRLQAMGHEGWVAVVDDARTDGGDAEGVDAFDSARLAKADDVDDDARTIDLANADEATVGAVADALPSWDADELTGFDLIEAEYDASELETTYESMDLDELTGLLEADMRHFDSPEAFGEYIEEFLRSVERSPLCDEDGRPDDIRYVMSHFLRHAQVLDDRFDFPLIRIYREAIERALVDFDPEQEARDAIERVRLGGG